MSRRPLPLAGGPIFDRFVESAEKNPDKTAFIYCRPSKSPDSSPDCQRLTYADTLDRAVAVVFYLKEIGLTGGSRAMICAENSPEWCVSYLAITAAGGVAVPVDSELGEAEIRNLVVNSDASFIFTSGHVNDKVQNAVEGLNVRLISFDSGKFNDIWLNFKRQDGCIPEVGHTLDDVASIIYTSGTTSTPKGVVLTHGNFLSDAAAVIETGLIAASDNVLSVLPLHHTYPFMCTFLAPLLTGATITYPPGLKGQELVGTIAACGVTILIGIPRLLEMFLSAIDNKIAAKPRQARLVIDALVSISHSLRRTHDINAGRYLFKAVQEAFGRQFRFISSGGARLNPDVMARLESYGFTVVEGYGLTETSPVVTFNPLNRRKPGSAGLPLKGVEIKAPKKTGNATPTEGEILIKGPMVTVGYLNMPDETANSFGGDTASGWFHTGDLGYLDEDGYLFITGRLKEVIVLSSGKNVYPEDVELIYSAIPTIKEICVYSDGGDTIKALVVPDIEYAKRMKIATVESAIKWEINKISTEIPPYMRIKGIVIHTEPLPRTRLGKIKRFQLKTIASSTTVQEFQNQQPVSDPYAAAVISIIKHLMELKRNVSPEENLELDLGIDSLNRLQLLGAIEEHFKSRLPADFGQTLHTVGELSNGVREFYEGAGVAPVEANADETHTDKTQGGFKEMFAETSLDTRDLAKVGLGSTLPERTFTRSTLWLIRRFIGRFYDGRLQGFENLPTPPYLICPNHTSYLDAFIVAALLPWDVFKDLYFQGAEDIFRSAPARAFARLGHVIPIDPNVNLERAMTTSAYLLRQGLSLCIFPEGGRSVDGTLQDFKKGVGILSKECGVPIIPARIDGAYEALPRGAFLPKPARITLTLGKPIQPDGMYQSISEAVKSSIAGMEKNVSHNDRR